MADAITPSKMVFILGEDQHGRKVTATVTITTGRQKLWTIERDAANQRDDVAKIMDLPHEVIAALAQAFVAVKAGP